jgi:cbb3-type cytochrome oxidase maturation protein
MSVLFVALPLALLLGGAAMLACVVCIRRGQFDDLETPAVRILIDDRPGPIAPAAPSPNTSATGKAGVWNPEDLVVPSRPDPAGILGNRNR